MAERPTSGPRGAGPEDAHLPAESREDPGSGAEAEEAPAAPERDELIEFAAAASHDLSTPLRLIAGYADLLGERVDQRDADVAAAMGGIRTGVERMQALVEGLVAYARSADEVPVEPVDADRIVQDTLAGLDHEIRESRAKVMVGDLPTVLATPGQLDQVFQNLIANAIRFRGPEPPRIEIGCTEEPGVWHFTVADNGIGISRQEVVRVFDLFKRSRAVRQRPGSGIGLAVVKSVVERHGGSVWVESTPGRGSTFHFTLPIQLRRREDPRVAADPE